MYDNTVIIIMKSLMALNQTQFQFHSIQLNSIHWLNVFSHLISFADLNWELNLFDCAIDFIPIKFSLFYNYWLKPKSFKRLRYHSYFILIQNSDSLRLSSLPASLISEFAIRSFINLLVCLLGYSFSNWKQNS